MNYKTEFSVQQLRTKNLNRVVTTLSVFVAAVIVNMLVPQLLIKYVYDPTKLVAAPPIFELLPLVTYSIALLYFFYAMLVNFVSSRKANSIESELSLYSNNCPNCNDENDEISDSELKELEKIVDEALKPKKSASKRKTVAAKKVTKTKAKK